MLEKKPEPSKLRINLGRSSKEPEEVSFDDVTAPSKTEDIRYTGKLTINMGHSEKSEPEPSKLRINLGRSSTPEIAPPKIEVQLSVGDKLRQRDSGKIFEVVAVRPDEDLLNLNEKKKAGMPCKMCLGLAATIGKIKETNGAWSKA